MKTTSAFLPAIVAAHASLVLAAASDARSTSAVALRGGPGARPVNFAAARLDPGWWRATTPTTTLHPPQFTPGLAGAPAAAAAAGPPGLFDIKVHSCTPFLSMPGTFLATPAYFENACKAVPAAATYLRLTIGEVTDYFKPKVGSTWCDMLTSSDKHMWSKDGTNWLTPNASTGLLGGSGDGWLKAVKLGGAIDTRGTPTFWGVKTPNTQTGGCCHTDYTDAGKAWAQPYRMAYCGIPQQLAPVCTPLASVAGSFSADAAYWTETCKAIPMTASYVKVNMGSTQDYFRPPTGKSYCEMLTASDSHKWSSDGDTWVDPKYAAAGLGGSDENGVTTGDARTKVSFWGSNTATDTGGCCYESQTDGAPGFGKGFIMSYCEKQTPTPTNQLVEMLHTDEAGVQALENELAALHNRLTNAERVNVDASGNVSLARSGMFKLAVKAKNEAADLSMFQRRAGLLGSQLDSAKTTLHGAEKRVRGATKNAKAAASVAQKTATPTALQQQDDLNAKIWKLMDPANKENLDVMETRVRSMEKDANKFVGQLREQVKAVMVTKMRRTVHKLRKMIHRVGVAGNKVGDGALGQTESDAPLGADLGLDDD